MTSAAQRAMTTWPGALAQSGVVDRADAVAGQVVAAFVVGTERLDEVRRWLSEVDPETAIRERCAAIEVCIWMAHADRMLHPEESHLLSRLVAQSGLDEDTQDALVAAVHEPPPIDGIEDRLTHPVLRELILALAWELALADGRLDALEDRLYKELAARLDVDADRAAEIREAIGERLN